jgi:hypothetical protein
VDDNGISSRVKQFITDHLESVMQLEVLLLLAGHSGQVQKVWTATDVAEQLRIDSPGSKANFA